MLWRPRKGSGEGELPNDSGAGEIPSSGDGNGEDASASSLPAVPAGLINPATGELVPATPENAAILHGALRRLEEKIRDAKAICRGVLQEESERQGIKTLRFEDGSIATISGGSEIVWDIERLQDGLVRAGLPEDRLEDLISTTVEYKVNNNVVRQLAAANPKYAAAIEAAKERVPSPVRVSVRAKEDR